MLPKINRISKEKDFVRLKKVGRKYLGEIMNVVIVKRGDDKPLRFAVIVSNKICKMAVKRNKLKRIFKIAVRRFVKNDNLGYDILLLPKSQSVSAKRDEIENEIKKMMQEIEIK